MLGIIWWHYWSWALFWQLGCKRVDKKPIFDSIGLSSFKDICHLFLRLLTMVSWQSKRQVTEH